MAREKNVSSADLQLPEGYYLQEDPDVLILRRSGGDELAVFSARGVTVEAILHTAIEHARGGSPNGLPEASMPSIDTAEVRLRVRFFGDFEALINDAPMPPCRSANALSILKYLLAHSGRPVSRDFLIGWLWPEASPKKARWSLNSSVHALRGFLNGHLPFEHPKGFVLCNERGYRLCSTVRVSSDKEAFDQRYARGRRLEDEGRTSVAAAEYEAAVGLYRDDYLLEDLYEDWTMIERERLANAYLYMLDRLAFHYARIGCPQRGVEACYKILEKDPCHEESHRRLITRFARLGLRERAFRQYRLCRRVLLSRYGAEPSPETHAAYRSVLAGEA